MTSMQWENNVMVLQGTWTLPNHAAMLETIANNKHVARKKNNLSIDLSNVDSLDTTGITLLHHYITQEGKTAKDITIHSPLDECNKLLDALWTAKIFDATTQQREELTMLGALIASVGRFSSYIAKETAGMMAFAGKVFVHAVSSDTKAPRFRVKTIVKHMEDSGVKAIPIVSLLAFLISIVLAYQGATQLAMFGADIFTIDLTAVSILREMGVLLTAIMIAGRSGSAFAAEIGVMKLRDETDALKTMGVDPMSILIIPRIAALIIMMPVLTFIADLCGLLGTAAMSFIVLDITLQQFIERCGDVIGLNTFMVGIVKAPVFGFLIGLVGCYQGMQVDGSAESVGRLTTASVVQSIFLVILADALFSILFSEFGL